jgi:hypothetical protein
VAAWGDVPDAAGARGLYAVNRHVDFVPYTTSFELADTSVRSGHWSLHA